MAAWGAGCCEMRVCSKRGPVMPSSRGRWLRDQVDERFGACMWRAFSAASAASTLSAILVAGTSVVETFSVPGTFGFVVVVRIPRAAAAMDRKGALRRSMAALNR